MECASKYVDMNIDAEITVECDEADDVMDFSSSDFENFTYTPSTTTTSSSSSPAAPAAIPKRKRKVLKANTNVISIKLGTLTQDVALATGDPLFCCKCGTAFSAIDASKLATSSADEKEKGEPSWKCCFCNTTNELNLDPEEYPRDESVDYMLEPPTESVAKGSSSSEKQLIFCIDISGSMCVTTEVEGKHQLKGTASRDRLSSFNTEGADQWLPQQRRNVTYVSRLQSVQAAVEAQISQMEKEQPKRCVGLVTFNNEVTIHGDGTQLPQTITGDKLYDYDQLLETGKAHTIRQPIGTSKSSLSTKLFSLEEGGATALGPALAVCVGIAGENPGSEIVVCTDGLSNVGLGQLDDMGSEEKRNQVKSFYEQLGHYAVLHGVTISIVSIKGENCSLENLGALAERTNGEVNIVDPLKITTEFGSILSQPIIATHVGVKLVLHGGLFIRDDNDDGVEEKQKNSFVEREVGNVTADSAFTFEYGVRPEAEMKELGLNTTDIKSLPFQLQIRYTKLDGTKCIRIISKEQPVTWDKQQAEQHANVDILGLNSVQQAAKAAQQGDYMQARLRNAVHHGFIGKVAKTSHDRERAGSWAQKQRHFDCQLQSVQKKEKEEGLRFDDEDDDEEACDAVPEERKMDRRKEKKKAVVQARAARRDDETANVLWSMLSKRKK